MTDGIAGLTAGGQGMRPQTAVHPPILRPTPSASMRARDLPATQILRAVMVVDDSPSQRRLLAMSLRRRGYAVSEAENGQQALDLAKDRHFDLVISDWMMPGMTGLRLCGHFRAMPIEDYTYFILLTSKHEKNEIARGLDAGADDFLIKPVNGVELDARIRAGARLVALHREVLEKNAVAEDALAELRGVYEAIERDLRQARSLQQSLLRTRDARIDGTHICLMLESSGFVGGDLVGFFPINARQVGVYALDVSGHGISAALMTARLAGMLSGPIPGQNLAIEYDAQGQCQARDLGQVLADMNRLMLQELDTDHYATLFLAVLDTTTGVLQAAQAGSPPGLIQRAAGRIQRLGQGGMPIGLIDTARYTSFRARLRRGDRLLLTSDGVTEAWGPDGRMLQTAGLARWLAARKQVPTGQVLDRLLSDLRRFTGGRRFEDDVSALILSYD